MKNITLLFCMFAIGFVHAQDNHQDASSDKLTFTKGTNMINGGLFFNTSKIETTSTLEQEDSRFGIGINSSYGYAISDDLFLGLGIGYTHNKRENNVPGSPTDGTTSNSLRVFAYIRYYKGIGKRLSFFVQGETQFSKSTNERNGDTTIETDSFFVGVRPGLTFMISNCLALETTIGSLGYSSSNLENKQSNTKSDASNFGLSLNTSNLVFGVSYYF